MRRSTRSCSPKACGSTWRPPSSGRPSPPDCAPSSSMSTWSSRSTGSGSAGCSDRSCSAGATVRWRSTSVDAAADAPGIRHHHRPRAHPSEPAWPPRRQPRQPGAGMRGADRVAAPRPRCEPDVVGLGRSGSHAAHPGPHRRVGRRGAHVAGGTEPARIGHRGQVDGSQGARRSMCQAGGSPSDR